MTALTLGILPAGVFGEDRSPQAQALQHSFETTVSPFLQKYCLSCHGPERQEAKLNLSEYSSVASIARAHQTWLTVLERVDADEMPPEDAVVRPSAEERMAVSDWIRSARAYEGARNAGAPGVVLARRLSNAEYNYSVRDLTGVDIRPTDTFPVDPANEAGFDNSGESLSMSPALLNKYLGAARAIVEYLVLTPDGITFAPHPVVTDTDRDRYCVKRIVQFYAAQPTDLAEYFFAAWQYQRQELTEPSGMSLEEIAAASHVSPKYLTTIWTLLRDTEAAAGPIADVQKMWLELPRNAVDEDIVRAGCRRMANFVIEFRQRLVPEFEDLYFEGNHKGSQPFVLWKNRQYAAYRRRLDRAVLQLESKQASSESSGNEAAPQGSSEAVDQRLRVPADDAERDRYLAALDRFCDVFPDAFYISERGRDYVKDSSKQDGERGRLLSAGFHSMMGYFRDDQPLYDLILNEAQQRQLDRLWLELDFITSAPMRQYVGFLWFERTDSRYMRDPEFDFARAEDKSAQSEEMIGRLAEVYLSKAKDSGANEVQIDAIEHYFREISEQIRRVERGRVRAEPDHVRAVLRFAERAFRRPLTPAENDELISFYRSLREQHDLSHEEAIQDTLVSILMSPHFCYRVDLLSVQQQSVPLTDIELASRLSYFLWSSIPDEELLLTAQFGKLHQPEVLKIQTARMLQDARVRGFATEFGGNWLDFRRFEQHNAVDRERFPEFTDELRSAMFEEPIRFFVDLIQTDSSVLAFLDADHTFVNPVLARHYRMPTELFGTSVVADRSPTAFRERDNWVRVDNAGQYHRGGLLPMSVFLTKNAPGLRTSPVKRGYWVVRRLLGERIPPPPPNVPELPNDETKLGDLTLAETLARHRDHDSCAGCHDRFDSIGLAFEGFGPIGEQRVTDLAGRPVDITAEFPGGHDGTGVAGLRDYLQAVRQEEFLDNLCRKLLSYGLGRSLMLSDDLLVQQMKENLRTSEFRFSSLIEAIVASSQFLNKQGRSVTEPD